MNAKIDTREPTTVELEAAEELAKADLKAEPDTLKNGDFYLPEKDVVIERKEASDFASSTTDGRLSRQSDRMIADHEHVYLILEGDPFSLQHSDITAHSILGMQTSLAVKRGIKIVYTDSVSDTVYAVRRIFERHLNDENSDTGYVKTHDAGEVEDVQVAMLMQIEGISEKKAREILDSISFDELADCATDIGYEGVDIARDAVMDVDGIGETLAERVISAFS